MTHLTSHGPGVTSPPPPPPPPPPQPPVAPQQPMSASAVPPAALTPQVPPMAPQAAGVPMQPPSQGSVPGYGIQAGVPQYGMTGNPLDPLRPVTPGVNPPTQGINPLTGQGYGYDPLTPMMSPAMASQGTPSHFSISTPPHPQHQYGAGRMQGANVNMNPLSVDPLTEVDPWGQYHP
eukprot:4754097-Amphidinium_carterae.1